MSFQVRNYANNSLNERYTREADIAYEKSYNTKKNDTHHITLLLKIAARKEKDPFGVVKLQRKLLDLENTISFREKGEQATRMELDIVFLRQKLKNKLDSLDFIKKKPANLQNMVVLESFLFYREKAHSEHVFAPGDRTAFLTAFDFLHLRLALLSSAGLATSFKDRLHTKVFTAHELKKRRLEIREQRKCDQLKKQRLEKREQRKRRKDIARKRYQQWLTDELAKVNTLLNST